MKVLLATDAHWAAGEPGHEHLDAALAQRGVDFAWARWDDDGVDWSSASLVAVRSTWDYTRRPDEFLAWARSLRVPLLNGADVFEWNHDKSYLTRLGALPTVPTRVCEPGVLAAARREWGAVVMKPRVGAGGDGLVQVAAGATLSGVRSPLTDWIVQPRVDSIFTEGELSVYVFAGVVVSMFRKTPGEGVDVRVNEEHGGTVQHVPVDGAAAELALAAADVAAGFTGRALDYCRIDMLNHCGRWCVSEIEAVEPGLYLDVADVNAKPFVDLVISRL